MRVAPRPPRDSRARPSRSRLFSFARASPQGYHRSYTANDRVGTGDRSKARGVCYHKVAGAPASTDIQGLLSLRPLVRRKKREAPAGEEGPAAKRRPAGPGDGASASPGAPRAAAPPAESPAGAAGDRAAVKVDDISLTDAAKCLLMMTSCMPKQNLVTVGSSTKSSWI